MYIILKQPIQIKIIFNSKRYKNRTSIKQYKI